MLVPLMVILAGRAEILRSVRLPQLMEVAAVVAVVVLQVLAVVAEVSVRRATLRPHLALMAAVEAAAVALRLLVSVP